MWIWCNIKLHRNYLLVEFKQRSHVEHVSNPCLYFGRVKKILWLYLLLKKSHIYNMYADKQTYIWIFTHLVWKSIPKRVFWAWRSVTKDCKTHFKIYCCQIAVIFIIFESEFVAVEMIYEAFVRVPTCLGCWGWGFGCSCIIIICNKVVIDKWTHLLRCLACKTQHLQANEAFDFHAKNGG